MSKPGIVAVTVIAVLLATVMYQFGRNRNQKEIQRALSEAAVMKAEREQLIQRVAERDSVQRILQEYVQTSLVRTDSIRRSVDRLETRRAEAQLTVRRLRQPEDLRQRILDTYPQLARTQWGTTDVYNEEQGLSISYILVPASFTETFLIEHQNAASYRAQRDSLKLLDTLQTRVIMLKDSIYVLEQKNRIAFQEGYDKAYASFEDVNEKYVKALKRASRPGWKTMLISASAGALVGVVAR